jgi:hypothetical protein
MQKEARQPGSLDVHRSPCDAIAVRCWRHGTVADAARGVPSEPRPIRARLRPLTGQGEDAPRGSRDRGPRGAGRGPGSRASALRAAPSAAAPSSRSAAPTCAGGGARPPEAFRHRPALAARARPHRPASRRHPCRRAQGRHRVAGRWWAAAGRRRSPSPARSPGSPGPRSSSSHGPGLAAARVTPPPPPGPRGIRERGSRASLRPAGACSGSRGGVGRSGPAAS